MWLSYGALKLYEVEEPQKLYGLSHMELATHTKSYKSQKDNDWYDLVFPHFMADAPEFSFIWKLQGPL